MRRHRSPSDAKPGSIEEIALEDHAKFLVFIVVECVMSRNDNFCHSEVKDALNAESVFCGEIIHQTLT